MLAHPAAGHTGQPGSGPPVTAGSEERSDRRSTKGPEMRRPRALATAVLFGLALALVLALTACNRSPRAGAPRAGADAAPAFGGGYPRFTGTDGLVALFGTPDLGVGTHRISYVLTDARGLVTAPATQVATYRVTGSTREAAPVETREARFTAFPGSARGLYVTELRFDRAGAWALEVTVPHTAGTGSAAGGDAHVTVRIEVPERPSAPDIGASAPASHNRTLRNVASVHALSTAPDPDPALYETTIAEALAVHQPLVVVFTSPGFCTTPLCGPQVEVLTALRERYGARARFIHVDLFENPQEIQGDLARARRTPLLAEWGLHTDEWTFVVGADGRVAARFEAFAPLEEVEPALQRVLR